jgi:hypothetical protein
VNDFAQGFEDEPSYRYDLICAFEAAEHFANPSSDLSPIFSRSDSAVLLSTDLYTGQGKDWWYLVPSGGQHVFFYSQPAMRIIADRFGFHYFPAGSLHLFTRSPLLRWRSRVLSRLMRPRAQAAARALLAYRLTFNAAAADSGLFLG